MGWVRLGRRTRLQLGDGIGDVITSEYRQKGPAEGIESSTEIGLQREGLSSYPQLCPRDMSSALRERTIPAS